MRSIEFVGSPVIPRMYRGWIVGAVVWLVLAVVFFNNTIHLIHADHIKGMWYLISLIWGLFGFAGALSAAIRGGVSRVPGFLLITLIPPLVLHFVLFTWIWP